MTTQLQVPNSTHISFDNRWVRLDAGTTAWLLELIDRVLVADLCGKATGDITYTLDHCGTEMLAIMDQFEFGNARVIHGGFDDEIDDGAG
jgi:hypothetical protein